MVHGLRSRVPGQNFTERNGGRISLTETGVSVHHNSLTEMCSGFAEGSYLRLIDFGITKL